MKKMLNDRGYALLIVLFTIIIFLSMSAVFMSASLNHVTQEQTVDKNNQAIVAAEMGVKLISSDVKNKIQNKLNQIQTNILTEKNRLDHCNTLSTDSSSCKSPAEEQVYLDTLKRNQLNMFNDFLGTLPNQLLSTYSNQNSNEVVSNEVTYYLESMKLKSIPQNKKQFEIMVHGTSYGSESSIKATIEFDELSEVFDMSNAQKYTYGLNNSVKIADVFPVTPDITCETLLATNLSAKSKPYNCKLAPSQSLSDLKDLISSSHNIKDFNVFIPDGMIFGCNDSCKGKDFTGLNIFVSAGDLFTKNLNNLKNANLYVNGNIDTQVANNLGNASGRLVLVSQGLSVKSTNGVENTTMVLLGKSDKSALFSITGNNDKFKLESTSKFCINADNFSSTSINEVKAIDGNGKIIYFTSKLDYYLSGFGSGLIIQRKTNLKEFLDACDVDSFAVGEGIDIPTIKPDLPVPVITEVIYN